jgi:hypothetical protein
MPASLSPFSELQPATGSHTAIPRHEASDGGPPVSAYHQAVSALFHRNDWRRPLTIQALSGGM